MHYPAQNEISAPGEAPQLQVF